MVDIKIVKCNVRGLRDDKKRREVFHYFNSKKWDIVALQEMHSTLNCENRWRSECVSPLAQIEIEIADRDSSLVLVSVH